MFAGTGVWKSKRGTPLLGRRCVFINDEHYGYNVRDELISADDLSYAYDDIGNRTTAEGKTYTANALNQYSAIDDFTPQYDADGNQTLIKTETGIWSVLYNAENRPIRWQSGDTVITMVFDRMGRRVEYFETIKNGKDVAIPNVHYRFVYEGPLCIQRLNALSNNDIDLAFGWDPTEPIATRPLWLQRLGTSYDFFYFHDGNKNVSDFVPAQSTLGDSVHYEYTPFGVATATITTGASSEFNVAEINPYRFSSEYADDALGLVYYNYRYYDPVMGRWLGRDNVEDITLYLFCGNYPVGSFDLLGNRSYTYEVNLKQSPTGLSFYGRVSLSESDCPKETEIELSIGIEWQPPQLRTVNRVFNLFNVHMEAGARGVLGGKVKVSECVGKSSMKVCGRLEAFARVEYRGWKVQEMGRRRRFTRSRFGAGADGGGTLCADLSTGEVTGSLSVNWYAYANFGWNWFTRTYNYGSSWESGEKLWATFDKLKLLPPLENSDDYNCCCEEKYGKQK